MYNCGEHNSVEVSVRHFQELRISPDLVWSVVGRFNDLTWLPGIESFAWEGRIRRFSVGGAAFIERLEFFDEERRTYGYSLIDGPLPVKHYDAVLKVAATATGCHVGIESKSIVVQGKKTHVQKLLEATYSDAIRALQKRVERLLP